MSQYSPEGAIPVHPSVRNGSIVRVECPKCKTPTMTYRNNEEHGTKYLKCKRGHTFPATLRVAGLKPKRLRPSQLAKVEG